MSIRKQLLAFGQSLLIVIFLAACSAQPAASIPAASTAATPKATAAGTSAEAKATATLGLADWHTIILNSFRYQNVKSYRSESDMVTDSGAKAHTTVEFVPPDRYHIISKPNTEMFLIGQEVLSKQGSEWSKLNVKASSIVDPNAINQLAMSIDHEQCTGPETVNGKAMYVCQYDSTTKIGDSSEPTHTQLWIEQDTNLPYKMIVDGAVAAMDANGKLTPVKATTTMTYTFDPTLQILPPDLSN